LWWSNPFRSREDNAEDEDEDGEDSPSELGKRDNHFICEPEREKEEDEEKKPCVTRRNEDLEAARRKIPFRHFSKPDGRIKKSWPYR